MVRFVIYLRLSDFIDSLATPPMFFLLKVIRQA